MKNIAILYHANCVDGFVAKTLMELLYNEENTKSIAVRYNVPITETISELIKLFDGKNIERIFIVDFSLSYSDLAILIKICNRVTIYDHHDTAFELYKDDPQFTNFNSTHYSAISAWIVPGICTSKIIESIYKKKLQELFRNKSSLKFVNDENIEQHYKENVVAFIDRVNDYDIWNLEYDDTFVLNESIRCIFESNKTDEDKFVLVTKAIFYYTEISLYSKFNVSVQVPYDVYIFVEKAKQIVADRNAVINHYVRSVTFLTLEGYKVPFVQCPSNICNYVGYVLGQEHPFVFTYWPDVLKGTVKISFRANKYTGVNVREIAEKHGGGGHNSAAGILMTYENFKLFQKLYVR